jgi:heme exporter protein A
MTMRVIAKNLAIRRGEDLIFNDVSFELGEGNALTITGPNGVGKSTLLRGLAGLLSFETGSFSVDVGRMSEKELHEYCHYIGHENAMKSELTVLDNMRFWQEQMGVSEISLSPVEAVEAFGLSHTLDLPFGFLSQGQRRRIALTKLFVSHRPIWLLDEPTAALDKGSSQIFDKLVDKFIQSGGIVIAATHVPLGFKQSKILEMMPPKFEEAAF